MGRHEAKIIKPEASQDRQTVEGRNLIAMLIRRSA